MIGSVLEKAQLVLRAARLAGLIRDTRWVISIRMAQKVGNSESELLILDMYT